MRDISVRPPAVRMTFRNLSSARDARDAEHLLAQALVRGVRVAADALDEGRAPRVLGDEPVALVPVHGLGIELDVPRVHGHDGLDGHLAQHLLAGPAPEADLVAGHHEVVRNGWGHHRVAEVVGVRGDEAPRPGRVGEQAAARAHGDELQVAVHLERGGGVHADGLDVRLAHGDEAREVVALAVEDLREGHLLEVPVEGGADGAPVVTAVCALAVALLAVARGLLEDGRGHEVLAEEELLPRHRPAAVGARHVGVHLRDGQEEVEVEGEDGPRGQHHKHSEGRVLKVSELHLHGPELGAPADLRVHGRGRLPAHRVPVGALDGLEVVRLLVVVHAHALLVHHQRVARKVEGDVPREGLVHAGLEERRLGLAVHFHVQVAQGVQGVVHVELARRGAAVDVVRDGPVARLGQAPHALANQERVPVRLLDGFPGPAALRRGAVVYGLRHDVPAAVRVQEPPLEDRSGGRES
mmetsp:Transcript_11685/g.39905  ORF Transcript_11685/g.39905 Transcript_11685/m.39905 type:complete len:468 (+) Transcript_11685:282-1685(+)